ncbi:TetR/AcrR family transcriptional regulator [Streptacidiphilus fuscans]|uniref:TetR/AcrR family transcriptional regulator n=1 Tax=Streptacidiphilus fuscans TaxID=2789292 RepID=A0A931AY82_9ACTN|nr:TetR/AcrR family transcriptional regulator [Streptacidiphilus fuscans]MBF9066748.1 TetR/AcrR family transcriptional regulator [Streptacidiphilus fuscans]
MSAEERREVILRVAVAEFATGGYHGTSTERIARRAGISQPYVFRLFPGKKALFLACAELCFQRVRSTLTEAARGLTGDPAIEAMGTAYQQLIADRNTLLLQLQLYVASASAEADIADLVRRRWNELWDEVRVRTGATDEEVNAFFANGMYINALLAIGIPVASGCWAGLRPISEDQPDFRALES